RAPQLGIQRTRPDRGGRVERNHGVDPGFKNRGALVERSASDRLQPRRFGEATLCATHAGAGPSADRGRYSEAHGLVIRRGGVCIDGPGAKRRVAPRGRPRPATRQSEKTVPATGGGSVN